MRHCWTFHSAGQLLFGRNAVRQLGPQAARLGLKRVLVITDAVLAGLPPLSAVLRSLEAASLAYEVFDGGCPEPSLEVAERSIEHARSAGCDGLLGLGGGSNMDLAKITAVVLAHGGRPIDYVGEDLVPGPIAPLICVPTTSGTGSEVSAASVLTDTDRKLKVGVLSNYLRPRLAVVDPELTIGCPQKVTADSGIDALTHAIEAYTAVDNADFPVPDGGVTVYQGRHPLGDMLAERAIELVGRHLVTACKEPGNLAAREGMSLAATLAGMAFSNVGVAVVHALEYPVGGATHCSHGAGNGLLLPYVMRFNMPVRRAAMARVAQLLGENTVGLDEAVACERAIEAVERIRAAIGIPRRLRELGVTAEQLPDFAEKAFAVKRILRVNPRPVTVDDLHGILEAAL